jgi:hypothetical protein
VAKTHHPAIRILFIDVNLTYINPTRQLLPEVFLEVGQTTTFGPGYVGRGLLERGLLAFIEDYGPFDVLVSTEVIPLHQIRDKTTVLRAYRNNYYFNFDLSEIEFLPQIFDDFRSLSGPKIVTTLQTDYYNLTNEHIDTLFETADYLIGWGSEFFSTVDKLMELDADLYPKPNDNWLDAIERSPQRIISIPAFVSGSEFNSTPLAARRRSWSVLGVNYKSRRLARQQLTEFGVGWKGKGMYYALALLTRLRVNPFNKLHSIRMFNYLFRRTLGQCKYSYTCGSSLKYPIRKFFEIPACGAVLVCDSCNGFEALGFKDKLNAFVCTPDEIFEVHMFLEDDLARAQAIADEGRKLVWRVHTISARAQQISDSLEAIMEGWFGGTSWHGGSFHISDLHSGSTHKVQHEAVEH